MSDPEDERSSQPGEIDATPVGTNEDDVATGADEVSIQIPENVTVRRSSGAAGPTVDSSRSAISSLMPTRGPAEEINEHEKACQNLKVAIDSFYSAHPLSENYSMVFARSCDKPMPPVPPDDELLQFLALDSSEISELDIRTVRLVLRSRMDEYEDMCTAVLDSVKYEKIKSRRSSVGEVNKTLMSDISNFRQPMEDVPFDKIKSVYEDFIQAPSAHGLPIDPPNTVDRSSFTSNSSRNSTGFVGTAQSETVVGFVGSAPPQSRFKPRRAYAEGAGGGGSGGSVSGGGGGGQHQARGRGFSKSNDQEKRRSESVARKMALPKSMETYGNEVKVALVDAERRLQCLSNDFKALRTSKPAGEDNPQEKYASSPVEELGNGKNRFPPRAVPNFFKWERHPAGVQPPLHLYTRYCVYADLFRLGYDGRLTTFGEAYQNTVDSKWGQKTQEFAQQHSTSKGNGGGGGGKGKKGGGGGNRKIFKSN